MENGPQRLETQLRQLEAEREKLDKAIAATRARMSDYDRRIEESTRTIQRTNETLKAEKRKP